MAALQSVRVSVMQTWLHWRVRLQKLPARRAVIMGALLAVLFGPGLLQMAGLSFRQWQLDRQLSALAAQRAQLTAEQERLQSDPAYVEGLIRSTFKVAQPGELVIPLDASQSSAQ